LPADGEAAVATTRSCRKTALRRISSDTHCVNSVSAKFNEECKDDGLSRLDVNSIQDERVKR